MSCDFVLRCVDDVWARESDENVSRKRRRCGKEGSDSSKLPCDGDDCDSIDCVGNVDTFSPSFHLANNRNLCTFTFESQASLGMELNRFRLVGAVVSMVVPGGQAARLGVKLGDVIIRVSAGLDDDGWEGEQEAEFYRLKELVRTGFRPITIRVERFSKPESTEEPELASEARPSIGTRESNVTKDCYPAPAITAAILARDHALQEEEMSSRDFESAVKELEMAQDALDRTRAKHEAALIRKDEASKRRRDAEIYLYQEELLQRRPPWDAMYKKLCEFKETHGHTWVPLPMTLCKMRSRKTDPTNNVQSKDTVATAGVSWDVEVSPGKMTEDTSSTSRWELVEQKFRRWVQSQRKLYRSHLQQQQQQRQKEQHQQYQEGCKDTKSKGIQRQDTALLTDEQFQKLKDLGFILSKQDLLNGPEWYDMYGIFVRYAQARDGGAAKFPTRCDRNPNLDKVLKWANRQRQRREQLRPDQIDALNRIPGFEWEVEKRGGWIDMLERLKQFKYTYGHCCVPKNWNVDQQLGLWVAQQRFKFQCKTDPLRPDRKVMLEEIGFVWNSREAKWKQRISELISYREKFGDCAVGRAPGPYHELGEWCHRNRTYYTQLQDGLPSRLTPEKVRELDQLEFVWQIKPKRTREATRKTEAEIWHEKYIEIKAFSENHGHCRVHQKEHACTVRNALKAWVTHQRKQYKLHQDRKPSSLTAERIRLLDDIGFDWNPVLSRQWKNFSRHDAKG